MGRGQDGASAAICASWWRCRHAVAGGGIGWEAPCPTRSSEVVVPRTGEQWGYGIGLWSLSWGFSFQVSEQGLESLRRRTPQPLPLHDPSSWRVPSKRCLRPPALLKGTTQGCPEIFILTLCSWLGMCWRPHLHNTAHGMAQVLLELSTGTRW